MGMSNGYGGLRSIKQWRVSPHRDGAIVTGGFHIGEESAAHYSLACVA